MISQVVANQVHVTKVFFQIAGHRAHKRRRSKPLTQRGVYDDFDITGLGPFYTYGYDTPTQRTCVGSTSKPVIDTIRTECMVARETTDSRLE